MILRKWNPKTQKYDPYEVPKNWKVSVYETDMDKVVNCAECGKEFRYGDSYASRRIHTSLGFGFAVCEKCYREETKELYGS